MQTHLHPTLQSDPDAQAAETLLRQCVHCGFCTATCPTYQVLGDERDSPRGRIYLIKQVLEGEPVTRSTQAHLDRCLTCRNCETTCPSGVQYGPLIDAGRRLVDARVPRPATQRLARWALREGLTSPLFAPALRLGQWLRPLLPTVLRDKVPRPVPRPASIAPRRHARKVLLLDGCVQPALRPGIGAATRRVLDACGIEAVTAPSAGCCGAIRAHLGDDAGGHAHMRRNIDAWWPLVVRGEVEAIVIDASGCSAMVKAYGQALASDPAYADRAVHIAALARDLSEWLPDLAPALAGRLKPRDSQPLAYHPPCTLQHGQRLRGGVEHHLRALGFDLQPAPHDSHLCCGSAGTYSVLQPALAKTLRDRKLAALQAQAPAVLVSANIGCITHLQAGTERPVLHWIEVLSQALPD
jgi:glycolate oxidase iron-sulfur subunit